MVGTLTFAGELVDRSNKYMNLGKFNHPFRHLKIDIDRTPNVAKFMKLTFASYSFPFLMCFLY